MIIGVKIHCSAKPRGNNAYWESVLLWVKSPNILVVFTMVNYSMRLETVLAHSLEHDRQKNYGESAWAFEKESEFKLEWIKVQNTILLKVE